MEMILNHARAYLPLREEGKAVAQDITPDSALGFAASACEGADFDAEFQRQLTEVLVKLFGYYASIGLPFEEAKKRMDLRAVKEFYQRRSVGQWFPLEDTAKFYPLMLSQDNMSVFRISAYLRGQVVPEVLQLALLMALPAFPHFASNLKSGFFWHYLERGCSMVKIERESATPCARIDVSGPRAQLFRVAYYKNRISVEFFHVLTDGKGGSMFVSRLVRAYLSLLNGPCYREEAPPNSTANGFRMVDWAKPSNMGMNRLALQLGGKRLAVHRVLHFEMDAEEVKAAAKRSRSTVTSFFLTVLMFACKASIRQKHANVPGYIQIQVPVDMRRFYPIETARNFATYCVVSMRICDVDSFEPVLRSIEEQLRSATQKEALDAGVSLSVSLNQKMRYVPLSIKKGAAALIYKGVGEGVFTTTFSNLGVITLLESESLEVEKMDVVLGAPSKNKASCAMITCNGKAVFSITKAVVETIFEETVASMLKQRHIGFQVKGSVAR